MKNQTIFTLAIITIIFISSCSPALYMPISGTIPTLEEKGELLLKGELTTSDPGISLFLHGNQTATRLTGTYGLANNIGIHSELSRSLGNIDIRKSASVGIGYFTRTAERNQFQVYLTGGLGSIDYTAQDSALDWNVSGNNKFVSIQPKYSILKEKVEFYLGTAFKQMYYSDIIRRPSNWDSDKIFLLEPSIGIVFKIGDIKIHSDVGISMTHDSELRGYYGGIGISKSFYVNKKGRQF